MFFSVIHSKNSLDFEKVSTEYCVLSTEYFHTRPVEVYMGVKNVKIRYKVPLFLIFSKTVSSLFVVKSINNFLRGKEKNEDGKYPCVFFLGTNGKILSTQYSVLSTPFFKMRGKSGISN
jgi:hypothetical protein